MAFCLWNWRFEDVGDGGVGERCVEENGGEWEVNKIGQRMESDDEVSAERVDSERQDKSHQNLQKTRLGRIYSQKISKPFF